MCKVARELVGEAVAEAREEAPAAGEHDVAHEYLAQLRLARAQRLGDELRDRLGQVRVRGLGGVEDGRVYYSTRRKCKWTSL